MTQNACRRGGADFPEDDLPPDILGSLDLSTQMHGDCVQHGLSPMDKPVLGVDFPLSVEGNPLPDVAVRQVKLNELQRLLRRPGPFEMIALFKVYAQTPGSTV